MSMSSSERYGFIVDNQVSIEWIQSGPNKGCPRLFLGRGKTPYLGRTLTQALDLAEAFVSSQASQPVKAAATKTGKKTTAGARA